MPQAEILHLADAVTRELNAHRFAEPFRAERGYLPTYDLAELDQLRVTVVPSQEEGRLDARHTSRHEYTIDVAIQCKPRDITPLYLDPLVRLTQEIADHFRFDTEPGGASLVAPRVRILYLTEHLQKQRQFTSVLSLTFQAWRTAL